MGALSLRGLPRGPCYNLAMEFSTWITFFAACWAISLSPGPGAVASMSAGVRHGFWRGYAIVIGLVLGIWTQVLVVSVGLGALMATSAWAFSMLKWLGVAYLVWLGIQQWRAAEAPLVSAEDTGAGTSRLALMLRGWMINTVNPKGTVFLLAVMPQFIDQAQPLVPQYLTIALTLAFTDLVVMAGYVGLASRMLGALRTPGQLRWMNRSFGGLFVAAGLFLAMFRRAA